MGDTCDKTVSSCPTIAPAALFLALYTLSTITHIIQAHHHRKKFCWVLIMGGIWEMIGMATRIAGSIMDSKHHASDPVDSTSFMFILLAPLWINAFVYMILGRLVHMFLVGKRLVGVKASRVGVVFVLADISSFLIQLGGGVMTLEDDPVRIRTGLNIYTSGTCLQETIILIVVGLIIIFSRRLKQQNISRDIRPAEKLVSVLFVVLALITFRIAFRIIEFSAPFDSAVYTTINRNEYFLFIFDSTPMFLALLAFNIFHPGKTLHGPDSEYPKLTKEQKKVKKEEKKRAKEEKAGGV